MNKRKKLLVNGSKFTLTDIEFILLNVSILQLNFLFSKITWVFK